MLLRRRLSAWIDTYPRALWLLALCGLLASTGMSFIWPLTTVYMHQHLGFSLTLAGVVLLLHSGGAVLGQLAGGWFYDRVGARPILLAGFFGSAALTAVLGLYEHFPVYVAVMILFGFTSAISVPTLNALVGRTWPEGGRRGFNFIYVARNIGVALGTALGGLLADRSFSLAFLGASALFLGVGLFVARAIRDRPSTPPAAAGLKSPGARGEERDVPWLPVGALFFAEFCLALVYCQWQSAGSVHMEALGYELSAYSVLWTLNGALIFLGQPLVSLAVRAVPRPWNQMVLGTVLYAASFGLLLTSTEYWIFVASMTVLTLGEMLLMPAIPAAVEQLSPPSRRGSLQGLVLAGATGGRMVGPLIGGMLYDAVGFYRLIAVMAAGLVIPLGSILVYARSKRA